MKCDLCGTRNVHLLMGLSVIALILSGMVSLFGLELWLAGTQWMLVSIVLAVYALVMLSCGCGSEGSSCCSGGHGCGVGSEDEEDDEKEQE